MPEGSSSLIEEAGLSETSAGGMEIGLYTFGELISNPHTGHMISAQQRVREIIAAAQLADEAGLDVVGQHRRSAGAGEASRGPVSPGRGPGGPRSRHAQGRRASHCHVGETWEQALRTFYPYYAHYFGNALPPGRNLYITPEQYGQLASPAGGLVVGSPQQVIDNILYEHELFGHQRFLAQVDIGGQPFDMVARSIELLATKVAPVVKRETRWRSAEAPVPRMP